MSRINVGGRDQTLTFKGNVGRLQQRGLISYDIPKLLNLDNFHFHGHRVLRQHSGCFDLHLAAPGRNPAGLMVLYRQGDRELTTMSYRFSYRQVEATNIEVSGNSDSAVVEADARGLSQFSLYS